MIFVALLFMLCVSVVVGNGRVVIVCACNVFKVCVMSVIAMVVCVWLVCLYLHMRRDISWIEG